MENHSVRTWVMVAIILVLAWLAFQIKKTFIRKMRNKQLARYFSADSFLFEMIDKILTVLILFVCFTLILQVCGVDIVPLLTVSGIGAAILGFASKDFIANFYGGLMIYMNRPFHVNDYIEIPSKNIAGNVEEIGWYLTTLRNMQKKLLYIPNSFFTTDYLINDSRMTHRRIEEVIRFRINEAERIEEIIKRAREIIQSHPEIDRNEQIEVFLLSIGPYGAVIDVKAYTNTTKYVEFMEIKQEILLKISSLGV